MKTTVKILLLIFMTFLTTPTIISVVEKDIDVSLFFSLSEEEEVHKEIVAVVTSNTTNNCSDFSNLNSGLILSENLSKHDKIASAIFAPPPNKFYTL